MGTRGSTRTFTILYFFINSDPRLLLRGMLDSARPSVSFSYESVLHNYFVRHNSLIFIFVRFFIAAFKYDGHESFLDSYVIKLYSHT